VGQADLSLGALHAAAVTLHGRSGRDSGAASNINASTTHRRSQSNGSKSYSTSGEASKETIITNNRRYQPIGSGRHKRAINRRKRDDGHSKLFESHWHIGLVVETHCHKLCIDNILIESLLSTPQLEHQMKPSDIRALSIY